jgi:hypothetical protein
MTHGVHGVDKSDHMTILQQRDRKMEERATFNALDLYILKSCILLTSWGCKLYYIKLQTCLGEKNDTGGGGRGTVVSD